MEKFPQSATVHPWPFYQPPPSKAAASKRRRPLAPSPPRPAPLLPPSPPSPIPHPSKLDEFVIQKLIICIVKLTIICGAPFASADE